MINGHNKNVLNEKKRHFPCNYREKTSCTLNGSCQNKDFVHSCNISTPDIRQNHPHYIGLTEHKFKDIKVSYW